MAAGLRCWPVADCLARAARGNGGPSQALTGNRFASPAQEGGGSAPGRPIDQMLERVRDERQLKDSPAPGTGSRWKPTPGPAADLVLVHCFRRRPQSARPPLIRALLKKCGGGGGAMGSTAMPQLYQLRPFEGVLRRGLQTGGTRPGILEAGADGPPTRKPCRQRRPGRPADLVVGGDLAGHGNWRCFEALAGLAAAADPRAQQM